MKVQELSSEKFSEFLKYCEKYGSEHDESYLPDEKFVVNEDNPTYILLNDDEKIIGAVSVIMTPPFRAASKARFRIFHSVIDDIEVYKLLLDCIRNHIEGIKTSYLFLPKEKSKTGEIFIKLGFNISRYSYYMERCGKKPVKPSFPKDIQLSPIRDGVDEVVWCDIINECFANLAGHVQSTPDKVRDMLQDEEQVKDGMMILWDRNKAIGTLCVGIDESDGNLLAFISCVAIMPEYRGKNLGRNLIRAAIEFGWENGYENSSLSVNAENTNAANLYLSEGFEEKAWCVTIFSLRYNYYGEPYHK